MTESEDPQIDEQATRAAGQPVDQHLDVRGLACPMPLLKAKQALNRLSAGALLEVRATDPGSERDFEVFAHQSGHELLRSCREQDEFVYILRKKR